MKPHCNRCRIGRLHSITTPYLTTINDQLMIVPDSPAYHCDLCGVIQYDAQFLHNIEQLIDQFLGSTYTQETFNLMSIGSAVNQPPSTRRSS